MFKKKLTIVANWKMNPHSCDLAKQLLLSYIEEIKFNDVNLVIAPPSIYLNSLREILIQKNIKEYVFLSAQNICSEISGAFTGEISAQMIKSLDCKYTIIGHSERRSYYQETNDIIAKKFSIAIKENLIPIICIGENKQQFDKGEVSVKNLLNEQLDLIIKSATDNINNISKFFIAYEPVWAIGTGKSADQNYVRKVCSFIFSKIRSSNLKDQVKLLYGGSVNKNNYQDLFMIPEIYGVLVGGASLMIEQFKDLCNANCLSR